MCASGKERYGSQNPQGQKYRGIKTPPKPQQEYKIFSLHYRIHLYYIFLLNIVIQYYQREQNHTELFIYYKELEEYLPEFLTCSMDNLNHLTMCVTLPDEKPAIMWRLFLGL